MNGIASGQCSLHIEAERVGKYVFYEQPPDIYGSIILSILDKKSKFGIMLEPYESATLRAEAEKVVFILKHQNCSGPKMQDMVKIIYCTSLMVCMNEIIRANCNECQEMSPIDSKHLCFQDAVKLVDKFLPIA